MIDIWELTDEQLDDLQTRLDDRESERRRQAEEEKEEMYKRSYCCQDCGKHLTCRERKRACDKCGTKFEDNYR